MTEKEWTLKLRSGERHEIRRSAIFGGWLKRVRRFQHGNHGQGEVIHTRQGHLNIFEIVVAFYCLRAFKSPPPPFCLAVGCALELQWIVQIGHGPVLNHKKPVLLKSARLIPGNNLASANLVAVICIHPQSRRRDPAAFPVTDRLPSPPEQVSWPSPPRCAEA